MAKTRGDSLNIRIVCGDKHWVLRRIAEGWAHYWERADIQNAPDPKADVNLYLPYDCFTKPSGTCDVVYFTHYRRADRKFQVRWANAAKHADLCLAMSENTARMIPRAAHKTRIARPGIDAKFFQRGPVSARKSENNRKRLDMIERLQAIPNVQIVVSGGRLRFNEMPTFYHDADYVLVLSDNEGGPMAVLEALAMKKPVIAPNVGWAWEVPVIRYETAEELYSIVERLGGGNWPECSGVKSKADAIYAMFQEAVAARKETLA